MTGIDLAIDVDHLDPGILQRAWVACSAGRTVFRYRLVAVYAAVDAAQLG